MDERRVPGYKAFRIDDIGASSKLWEVYGLTRIRLGGFRIPFPGNWLFLKYIRPFRQWGPYPELSCAIWKDIIRILDSRKSCATVAITAGWVEYDGGITPFPKKYPGQAAVIKEAVKSGILEVANHGLTHCVTDNGAFLPRPFSSNRNSHREFWSHLAWEKHAAHIARAQDILESFFATDIVTFVPPGNVFPLSRINELSRFGFLYYSSKGKERSENGVICVGEEHVSAIHDKDIHDRGVMWFERLMDSEFRYCSIKQFMMKRNIAP